MAKRKSNSCTVTIQSANRLDISQISSQRAHWSQVHVFAAKEWKHELARMCGLITPSKRLQAIRVASFVGQA